MTDKFDIENIDITGEHLAAYIDNEESNILHPIQQQAAEVIYSKAQSGEKNLLIQMPTGTGKTYLLCHLIEKLTDSNNDDQKVLIISNHDLLSQQLSKIIQENLENYDVNVINKEQTYDDSSNIFISHSELAPTAFIHQFKLIVFYDDLQLPNQFADLLKKETKFDGLLLGFTIGPEQDVLDYFKTEKPHFSVDLKEAIEMKLSSSEKLSKKYKSLQQTFVAMTRVKETGMMVRIPERVQNLINQNLPQTSSLEENNLKATNKKPAAFFEGIKEWFRIQGPGGFSINLAQVAVAGVILVIGIYIGRFQIPTEEDFTVHLANHEFKEYVVDSIMIPKAFKEKLGDRLEEIRPKTPVVFRGIPKAAIQDIEKYIDNKTSDDQNKLILEREKFIREIEELERREAIIREIEEPKRDREIEELKREEIIREASEDLDFALSGVIEEILEERRISSTVVIGESKFAIKLIGSFKNSNGELCDNGEINGDGYENQLFVGCQSNGSWSISFARQSQTLFN